MTVFQACTDEPLLGLGEQEYRKLVRSTTHILHAAWPMNFKQTLSSFHASFRTLRNLIQLACESHTIQPLQRRRLLFTSSISTVGNHPSAQADQPISEVPSTSDESALELGYARAKLVCEKMIEKAAVTHPEIEIAYVRVGQIVGARSGIWNADEHFVAILCSSQRLAKFPDLQGVSVAPTFCQRSQLRQH